MAFIPLAAFLLRAGSVKLAFAGGLVAGFAELFILLVWMPPVLTRYGGLSLLTAWFCYVLLIGLLSCYPAAACAIARLLISRRGEVFIFLFPPVWIVFEYLQSVTPFGGFPWLLAGYSQSRFLPIIQITDITGVYGVSFLLVWTGTAVVWLARRRGRGLSAWGPAAAAALLIAASLVYGFAAMHRWSRAEPRFAAALFQGNITFDDANSVMADKFEHGYVRMAERLKPAGADLAVLPESPSPLSFETDLSYRRTMEELARRFPLGLIMNNIRYEGSGEAGRYFNTAYFLDSGGSLRGIYDKIHLVPFGEYIPLTALFSFIETISKDVGSFSPGSEYRVIDVGRHPASAIICFEAAFPRLVSRFVREGSQLIVNLTNDHWYGDSAAPYQHLALARFRAVENRRYLLRAANSGVSAIIGPDGRIQAATGIMREAICRGRFDFIAATTFYTRRGDVFVLLCAIISCGLLIPAAGRSPMRRRVSRRFRHES